MDSAARWAAASAPASTDLSSTSEYAPACAFALLVMAAIQPWSAAGAEKPMVTFLPGAALPPESVSAALVCAAVGAASLLVHAVSRAPAPSAAPPNSSRRRDRSRLCWVIATSW
ncbi:hypothetical protein GCM10010429_56200 [Micromonospora olivasterospora]